MLITLSQILLLYWDQKIKFLRFFIGNSYKYYICINPAFYNKLLFNIFTTFSSGCSKGSEPPNETHHETSSEDNLKNNPINKLRTERRNLHSDKYNVNDYVLGSQISDSWCRGDRLGSNFQVSDVYGQSIYYFGTLVNATSADAPCDLSTLPSGDYIWRVTGAVNHFAASVSYQFCGIKGGASSQIKFKIDSDGACVPTQYLTAMDICAGEQYMMYLTETELILHGTVHIEGIQTSDLTQPEL
jgi:hypothetical protein